MLAVTRYFLDNGHLGHGHPPASVGSSYYGIGLSVIALPALVLQRAFADPTGLTVVTVTNMLVLAATTAVVVRICLAAGLRLAPSVLAGLAFGVATMAVAYSSTLLSEPGVTFGTAVAVLGVVRWRQGARHGPLLAGAGAAWCVLFRADSLVLVVAPVIVAVAATVPKSLLLRRRSVAAFLLPPAAAVGWTLYYNSYRGDGPFGFGYPGQGFTFPWADGMWRQLASPGKGFFFYNPILVLALPGLVVLWRVTRAVTVLIVALCLLRVGVYAAWWDPDGSLAFGPRFLLPWCALLAVPLAAAFQRIADMRPIRRTAVAAVATAFAAASVFVVGLSVWVPQGAYWLALVRTPAHLSSAARTALIAARVDASNNTWTGSPLAYAARSLPHAQAFNLFWWRGGLTVFGLTAAAAAACLGIAAVWAARRPPRDHAADELLTPEIHDEREIGLAVPSMALEDAP